MENNNIPDNAFIEQVTQRFGQIYFSYDITGSEFRYISPILEKFWGIKPESILSNPATFLTSVHDEDKEFLSHQYQKLLVSHEQTQAEFRIVLSNKEIRWVCLSACFLQDEKNHQNLIGGFAEDVTAHKEYTTNIMKYNNKKNSTLEILSHDLATPFANIQGIISAIEEQMNQGDVNIQQLLSYIKQDALRGSDMIRDFVNNEFLESSQVVLHKERVDLASKITIMMDNYKDQEQLVAKSFKLVSPKKPILIYIDMMKFMQVMNNLISNAIKFTQDNGIITVSLEDKEEHALITVTDNGIGIPAKMQPFLFDRFTPARRAGIRGEKSVGLGMSIIKTIIELHSGEISFDSEEGAGTTFYIKIPKE
ncbi:ATP-binding protein [Pontibacter silvestris]|uniref:histidine kinase n=1 Tax=Pontibacter silvestris TaxID=2305183 RepID=A0ABW4X4U1_9BACT|nr:PAS domain-containing sensor histidine kinase [Pontibacter silvestris]MCC9134889.1 PAS domain-containing sensor histidine kinase [Pontibacter silvestris]